MPSPHPSGDPVMENTIKTPAEFAEQMRYIQRKGSDDNSNDIEFVHIAMDNAMADLLESLGYSEGVQVFQDTYKWYS